MIEQGEVMTPKEYAECIVKEFRNHAQQSIDKIAIEEFESKNIQYTGSKLVAMMDWSSNYHAKQCALIAVNGIIVSTRMLFNHYIKTHGTKKYIDIEFSKNLTVHYFLEVKQEIEKL